MHFFFLTARRLSEGESDADLVAPVHRVLALERLGVKRGADVLAHGAVLLALGIAQSSAQFGCMKGGKNHLSSA